MNIVQNFMIQNATNMLLPGVRHALSVGFGLL